MERVEVAADDARAAWVLGHAPQCSHRPGMSRAVQCAPMTCRPPPLPRGPGRALRADAGRPFVTFYDDATGERIELSVDDVRQLGGQDGRPGPGRARRRARRAASWSTCRRTGSARSGSAPPGSLGLAVTDDPALAAEADLVVCGPDGVATYASHAGAGPGRRALAAPARRAVHRRAADGGHGLRRRGAGAAGPLRGLRPAGAGGRRPGATPPVRRPRPTSSRRPRRPASWSRGGRLLTDVEPVHPRGPDHPPGAAAGRRRRGVGAAPRRGGVAGAGPTGAGDRAAAADLTATLRGRSVPGRGARRPRPGDRPAARGAARRSGWARRCRGSRCSRPAPRRRRPARTPGSAGTGSTKRLLCLGHRGGTPVANELTEYQMSQQSQESARRSC